MPSFTSMFYSWAQIINYKKGYFILVPFYQVLFENGDIAISDIMQHQFRALTFVNNNSVDQKTNMLLLYMARD